MKKGALVFGIFFCSLSFLFTTAGSTLAQHEHHTQPTASEAFTAPDIQKVQKCSYCGMDRGQFAFSRVMINYDDGSSVGTCSLHCAAVDLALNIDKTPTSIEVGDLKTKKLIDAETATWVIGGNKPGVMSKRAKWAFADKAEADSYIKENGGEVASFDVAMKATYEDMYADTKMIREKRKMKKMQMMQEKKQ